MRSKDIDRLGEAINSGDCSEIDAMIREGRLTAAYTTKSDKWNMLHMELVGISDPYNLKLVRHLIKIGVDVNASDACGWTPLHFAVRGKSRASVVKSLLEAGANCAAVDREGISPLYRSLMNRPWKYAIIKLLLDAGASLDQPNKYKMTPWKYANMCPYSEKPKLLALFQKYRQASPKRKKKAR